MTSNVPTNDPRRSFRAFVVVAALLLAGMLLNIGFRVVLPATASGFRGHEDNSLSTLVVAEQPELQVVFGFEAYLHDVARDGLITIPDRRAVFRLIIENLSQMTVVEAEYDSEITRDRALALDPAVQIAGKGTINADHDVVRYWIFTSSDIPIPAVTLYRVGDDVYIIDDRLGTP